LHLHLQFPFCLTLQLCYQETNLYSPQSSLSLFMHPLLPPSQSLFLLLISLHFCFLLHYKRMWVFIIEPSLLWLSFPFYASTKGVQLQPFCPTTSLHFNAFWSTFLHFYICLAQSNVDHHLRSISCVACVSALKCWSSLPTTLRKFPFLCYKLSSRFTLFASWQSIIQWCGYHSYLWILF